MYHNTSISKPKQTLAFILCVLIMFMSVTGVCYADPNTEAQPEKGWVHIRSKTPEGFTGSVSIILLHIDSGESYTLTAHRSGDFKNSMEVPVGEYMIMKAFTSEDNFIYEAISDISELTADVDAAQTVNVEVIYNEEGAKFLESAEEETPEATDEQPMPEQEIQPDNPNEKGDTQASLPNAQNQTPSSQPDDNTTNSQESPAHEILVNFTWMLTSALLFAGTVYGCCWLYMRYKENNE